MLTARDVALYFLSLDPERNLFNQNIVTYNNRKSYEGNIRLNKYLFLAQVVYLAKYEEKLFSDDIVAYENGPVVISIMNSYGRMVEKQEEVMLPANVKDFLDKIYFSLLNATYEELILITHEDPEWQNLHQDTYNAPIMDLEKNILEYKKRYKGLIAALKI